MNIDKVKNFFMNIIHPSEFAQHPKFKSTLNTIFLTFSCLLIVSSYVTGINNWFAKICTIVFLIVLDVAMQWILGLSKAYWKAICIKWHKVKAGILLFLWLLYVIIYAVPTAVGFFMNTFNFQNQIIQQTSDNYDFYKDEYDQNKIAINNLNNSLSTESKTGYRKYSITASEEYQRLQKRQEELRTKLNNLSNKKIKVVQSSDQTIKTIAKPFKLTEQILMLIVCSISVFMIYVILALTAWEVEINNKNVLESKLDSTKKELLTWIDAAFEGRSGNALNGVATIAEKTGMSMEKCLQYRKYLSELKINGEMSAITVDQGFCKANYTKESMKNYI